MLNEKNQENLLKRLSEKYLSYQDFMHFYNTYRILSETNLTPFIIKFAFVLSDANIRTVSEQEMIMVENKKEFLRYDAMRLQYISSENYVSSR